MPTPYARHAQRSTTRPLQVVGFAAAILLYCAFWLAVGVLIAVALVGGPA